MPLQKSTFCYWMLQHNKISLKSVFGVIRMIQCSVCVTTLVFVWLEVRVRWWCCMCWYFSDGKSETRAKLCARKEGLKEEEEKEITKESFPKLAFQEIRKEKGDRKEKKQEHKVLLVQSKA